MAVLNNVEFMRIYDRARFALRAEAEKRKELVVEGNRNRHVSNCYLNMIDDRLHSSRSSFGRDMRIVSAGLTTCRSAASGKLDAHSASTDPPLVGCSGVLGGDDSRVGCLVARVHNQRICPLWLIS